jgi:hypothetical protein
MYSSVGIPIDQLSLAACCSSSTKGIHDETLPCHLLSIRSVTVPYRLRLRPAVPGLCRFRPW